MVRWLAKRKFRFFRRKAGFTLIETVVALGILAAIAVGFLAALDTNSRATRQLDERVTAANLATTYLEAIRQCSYADTYPNVDCLLDDITIPFQYDVSIDTACSSDGTTFGTCTGAETFQRITVTISREGRYILSVGTYRCER